MLSVCLLYYRFACCIIGSPAVISPRLLYYHLACCIITSSAAVQILACCSDTRLLFRYLPAVQIPACCIISSPAVYNRLACCSDTCLLYYRLACCSDTCLLYYQFACCIIGSPAVLSARQLFRYQPAVQIPACCQTVTDGYASTALCNWLYLVGGL